MTEDGDKPARLANEIRSKIPTGLGYTIEELHGFVWTPLGENWLVSAPDLDIEKYVKVKSGNSKGNVVCVAGSVNRTYNIFLNGDYNIAYFGGNASYNGTILAYLQGSGSFLFLGDRCQINGVALILIGDKIKLVVGDDCLIAPGSSVRTQDQHAIVDLTTGKWLNPPRDVHIEPHVWLAKDVSVHSGSKIGLGCIIGERSIVRSNIPRNSVAVGAPARVVKSNVSWGHWWQPGPDLASSLREFEMGFDQMMDTKNITLL